MRLIIPVALFGAYCLAAAGTSRPDPSQRRVSFARDVRPFLEKNCSPCHFGGQRAGGLSLSSVADLLKGGGRGAAIVRGKPDESRLVLLMEHKAEPKMPPIPDARPLDTRLIRAWIEQGAGDEPDAKPRTADTAPAAQKPPTSGRASTDSRISSAAFSPNGQILAVGGYGRILLLESATGKQLGELKGHPGAVTSLAFTPDGLLLFAGCGQPGRLGEVQAWDMAPLKNDRKWTLADMPPARRGHNDAVYSTAVSPNGKLIAAGSYDHDVSLWSVYITKDLATSRPRYLKDHTDSVYGVAFSPDSKLLATASGDRTVKIWSVETGKRLYTLGESTAEVYSVAFSPSGRQVAAGGADKTLRVWNVTPSGGKLAKAALAHDGPILGVVFARDGRDIYTSGQDQMVKRWDSLTLTERRVYPKQPDWPQAIALSPNGKLLAIGRHDGSLAVYDAATGRLVREPIRAPAIAAKPSEPPSSSTIPGTRPGDKRRRPRKNGPITLTPASLSNITPLGARRGRTVRFTLTGANIGDALAVYFDDDQINGSIVTPLDSNRGILRVDAQISSSARIGIHRAFVHTPRGATGTVTFAIGDWPETPQSEPNDQPQTAQKLLLPSTAIGAIDQPGDVDSYAVTAEAGDELVFEVLADRIRSRLQPVLTLLDPSGTVAARSRIIGGKTENVLGYRCDKAGTYTLQLRDFEGASGGDVYYRLNMGRFPLVTDAFPLGLQAGTTAPITLQGFNLGGKTGGAVTTKATASSSPSVALQFETPAGRPLYPVSLTVGDDPEIRTSGSNISLPSAQPVSIPVTINGRLMAEGAPTGLSQYFRFSARKGEKLIIETLARRQGSRLDSEIEVLDSRGGPVERAVLRAVGQTELVLVDRDSVSPGLRLQAWDDFHMNDLLLIGREVVQIQRLPAGPDEDTFFRAYRGQRVGLLGTTPEYHSVGERIYKVEVHPPGSNFSPTGFPLRKISYRNDDGGPLYGKDSFLEFDPPADGEYVVRLTDPRGQSGEEYSYRLMIHPPRPNFKISMNPEHPSIPQAGSAVIEASCERYDGFSGPIEVRIQGLPPGFTATETTIEAGETSAFIQITAEPGAVTPPSSSSIRLAGRAVIGGAPVTRSAEPERGIRLLTVLPPPDIKMATDVREVAIRPGQEIYVEARVERQGDFGNRVPVIVQNLPAGVRVTDIGLNGVLITEEEEARRFTIYAEPWVQPQTRVFYVTGNVEGGVANSAPPLLLKVLPAGIGASGKRAAR